MIDEGGALGILLLTTLIGGTFAFGLWWGRDAATTELCTAACGEHWVVADGGCVCLEVAP